MAGRGGGLADIGWVYCKRSGRGWVRESLGFCPGAPVTQAPKGKAQILGEIQGGLTERGAQAVEGGACWVAFWIRW